MTTNTYTALQATDKTVLATLHDLEVIGVIETRRGSHGSYDGGVVAYRQANHDPADKSERYATHYYSIHPEDGHISLAVGHYDMDRETAMRDLLNRAQMQGQGMWHPSMG